MRIKEEPGWRRGKPPGRLDDLVPSAVIQAEIHLHIVIFTLFLGPVAQSLQLRAELRQVTKEAEADTVLLHIPQGFLQIPAQQLHNARHLVGRSLPVLRGEGVHRQVLHTQGAAVIGDAPEGLRAGGVTGGAGQTPLLCPASVAIHDDGNMAGRCQILRKCQNKHLFLNHNMRSLGALCAPNDWEIRETSVLFLLLPAQHPPA